VEHSQALGGLLMSHRQQPACHPQYYLALLQGWQAQRSFARSHAVWEDVPLCYIVALLTACIVGTILCKPVCVRIAARVREELLAMVAVTHR